MTQGAIIAGQTTDDLATSTATTAAIGGAGAAHTVVVHTTTKETGSTIVGQQAATRKGATTVARKDTELENAGHARSARRQTTTQRLAGIEMHMRKVSIDHHQ